MQFPSAEYCERNVFNNQEVGGKRTQQQMRHGALCISASEHQIESHSNSQPETNDPQMAMDICLQMSFKFENFT